MKRVMVVMALVIALGAFRAWAARGDEHAALVTRGQALFRSEGCYGCHMVGKFGTPIGPDLSHVGVKYPEQYIARWLEDPQAQRPTAHMPKLELSRDQVEALAAYMASLR